MKILLKLSNLCCLNALFLVLVLSACSTDEEVLAPESPELPPLETMVPDFSAFEGLRGQASPDNGRSQNFLPNATVAYLNYVVWNTLLTIDMALPVAAFSESFNHDVTYDSDNNRWVWAYSIANGDDTFEANLFASMSGDAVRWEMYASKTGDQSFEDVLWFKGTSSLDRKSGEWIIYKDADAPRQHLLIDWERNNDEVSIRFTSLDEAPESRIPNGSYVEYGYQPEENYNFFYNLFFVQNNDLPADKLIEIRYNTDTKEGSIRSAQDFDSEGWNCWNSQFENVECL